jgi:hypothetical protein
MPFTSETFLISEKLADHIRTQPEESSRYDDGAVIQEEHHRTTVSTSPEDRDRVIYTD